MIIFKQNINDINITPGFTQQSSDNTPFRQQVSHHKITYSLHSVYFKKMNILERIWKATENIFLTPFLVFNFDKLKERWLSVFSGKKLIAIYTPTDTADKSNTVGVHSLQKVGVGVPKTITRKEYIQSEELKQTHGVLYQQLNLLHQLFQKHSIRYWAAAGTMLGVVRDKGIFAWDDDIDLQVHPDDTSKFFDPAFRQEAKNLGFYVLDFWDAQTDEWSILTFAPSPEKPLPAICSTNVHKGGNKANPGKERKTVHPNIDVFFSSRNGEKVTYKGGWPLKLWPKEWVSNSAINDLREVPFGPVKILVPNEEECKAYLDRAYGKDKWYNVGFTAAYNHLTRDNSNEVRKIIYENDEDHRPGEYILDPALPGLTTTIFTSLNDVKLNLTHKDLPSVIDNEFIKPFYAKPLPSISDVRVPVMNLKTYAIEEKKWSSLSKEEKLRVNNTKTHAHNQVNRNLSESQIDHHFFAGHNNDSYIKGDPREHHGNDHSVRAAIFSKVFAHLYNKYHPEYNLSANEILLAQLLAAGHDSGRQTEGPDVYDEHSADNSVAILKKYGLDDEVAILVCREAIGDKDCDPISTARGKSFIAKCVQNADSAEFARLVWTNGKKTPGEQSENEFNKSSGYLDIYKEMKKIADNNAGFLTNFETFADFERDLNNIRMEMNKLIKFTHNKEFRQGAVNNPNGYYTAIASLITQKDYPLMFDILNCT